MRAHAAPTFAGRRGHRRWTGGFNVRVLIGLRDRSLLARFATGVGLVIVLAFPAGAAAPPAMPVPAGADTAEFVSIFDGQTLSGWDADPKYWRVEDGMLVGEVTPATLLKANSFAIWRGGAPGESHGVKRTQQSG